MENELTYSYFRTWTNGNTEIFCDLDPPITIELFVQSSEDIQVQIKFN